MSQVQVLNRKVSFQPSASSPITKELSIQEVIDEIRSEKYAGPVNRLRDLWDRGDIKLYGSLKKQLPAVTFCGEFGEKRKRFSLKTYNQLMVIDIDKLGSEELQKHLATLRQDQHLFAIWKSPSGYGIKGLVVLTSVLPAELETVDLYHDNAFAQVRDYFRTMYGISIDKSGSDTTRLCFMSYDPDLFLKIESVPFPVLSDNLIEGNVIASAVALTHKPKTITLEGKAARRKPHSPSDRKTLHSIIRYLTKRRLSITDSYFNWYRVAYAISDSFGYELGEKYFLTLSKLDGPDYNETGSRSILNYCYDNSRGSITFRTIVYLATTRGYKDRT